ncbi:MAG: hypothetical protein KBF89_02490 [Acidimicrobiia bacterium]|nr:hypothetical protein [Acidimicrobiia bacterium]
MSKRTSNNEMHQNATDIELSPKQTMALDLLLQGQGITAVSKEIGVDRSTIYRWQGDVNFEAEKNKKARELRDATNARLVQLAEKSLSVVDDALESGDAKVALSVLKGIGYLNGSISPIGPADPEQLEMERLLDEKRKDHEDTMNRLMFSL